jgi:hypothetical protein
MDQKLYEPHAGSADQHPKTKGDSSLVRSLMEQIRSEVPYKEALIVTTLPRGSLQIAQPQNVSEGLLKAYAKDFHAEDRLTWQVIIRSKALRLSDAWFKTDLNSVRYNTEFLRPAGLVYGIAAKLTGPVFDGYPGAIHLYRDAQLGDFSNRDLVALERLAHELDEAIQKVRGSRAAPQTNLVLPHVSPVRQFVFDDHLQPQVWPNSLASLDARRRQTTARPSQRQGDRL